jgi:hypothetical protein
LSQPAGRLYVMALQPVWEQAAFCATEIARGFALLHREQIF